MKEQRLIAEQSELNDVLAQAHTLRKQALARLSAFFSPAGFAGRRAIRKLSLEVQSRA